MANFVQTQLKCYLGPYDLPNFKGNNLTLTQEPQDAAVWGVSTRIHKTGLTGVAFGGDGLGDHAADGVETILSAQMGLDDRVVTLAPVTGAEGERAYSFGGLISSLQPLGGAVGELSKFVMSGMGASGLWFHGPIDHAKAARTTSGNGAGRQLGAVATGEKLYATLHVFAASGTSPTLDVEIESDDNSGFTTPTSRLTFAQKVAAGAEIKAVAGPFTDDYYRVKYTIGGTTPSFTFAVVIGRRG